MKTSGVAVVGAQWLFMSSPTTAVGCTAMGAAFLAITPPRSVVVHGPLGRIRKVVGASLSMARDFRATARGRLPGWRHGFLFLLLAQAGCAWASSPEVPTFELKPESFEDSQCSEEFRKCLAELKSSSLGFADYCWSEQHFLVVDLPRTIRATLKNENMLVYQTNGGDGSVDCAYPVDPRRMRALLKQHRIPLSERVRVTP